MTKKIKETIKVRRKKKCGTHTYMPPEGETVKDLLTIKGGELWDCPASYVSKLDKNQWDILNPEEEAAIGGPSRRLPPEPKQGLTLVECPDQQDMFDVVNEKTGHRINNDPLTKEEAESMIAKGTS